MRERERRVDTQKRERERGGGGDLNAGWPFVIAYSPLLAVTGRGPLSAIKEGALLLPSPLQKSHTQITERNLMKDSPVWGRK